MEKMPQPLTPEEIAKWREENKDKLQGIKFAQAPDGTLMRYNEKGELSEDQKETLRDENKDLQS